MSMTAPAPRAEGMRGLKGKNVLVTGGTSGIGQAIAVRFAEYGAHVAINYLRQPDEAAETEEKVHACIASVRQQGVRDVLVKGDVSSETDVAAMVEQIDRVIAVNLRGAFLCAREAIRRFLADGVGGSIINVSSVHQLIPKPGYL